MRATIGCAMLQLAAAGIPSAVTLAWQGQFGAIIHYNLATFAHHQGCSRGNWAASSNASIFGTGLGGSVDTDSWGRAMQAANMSYAIYVAKHSCGFTTWPSTVKLPDGSPYNYSVQFSSCPDCNVVANFLATCAKYNIRPGFYYSLATNTYLNVEGGVVQSSPLLPGQVLVTQQQFYDIALGQLEELWSVAPGALFEVWFDGGLPTAPYFQTGITALLAKYQPQAATYNGYPVINTTSVRWIGTEAGDAPDPTWSSGSCGMGNQVCDDCSGGPGGDPDDPVWCPAEVDSTLQADDTWFYVEGHPLHGLPDLQAAYVASLGRNSNWLLDIAPPPNSTVVLTHQAGYQAIGDWVRGCFGAPLAAGHMAASQTTLLLPLPGGDSAGSLFNVVRLREDQAAGQRVRVYALAVQAPGGGGAFAAFSNGTSVGAGKIDTVAAPVAATALRLVVDAAPAGLTLEAFLC